MRSLKKKTSNYNEAIIKSARLSFLTEKLFSLLHLLQFKAVTEQFDIDEAIEKIGGLDAMLNSMNRIGLHYLDRYTEMMRSIPDLIETENYATHICWIGKASEKASMNCLKKLVKFKKLSRQIAN